MKYVFIFFFFVTIVSVRFSSAQSIPVKEGNKFKISVGDVELVVDASFGARITSFKLGSSELLMQTGGGVGSTLWTSPQSEWGWPTLPTTDTKAYTGTIEGESMVFKSGEETGIKGKKFVFQKSFKANESNNSISIRNSLINTGSEISNALWEVTRVKPDGLTFWKAGDKTPWYSGSWTAVLKNKIQESAGYYWLQFDIANGTSNKFFSGIDKTGWFAHVNKDNVIFIKSFDDVASADFAPGEGEFEYYTGGTYIELENQSKYATIAAGDTFNYDVTWYVRKLPDDIAVEIGSTALIDYVNKIVSPENTSSVDELSASNLTVYPNPVIDQLVIDLGSGNQTESSINLYNTSGCLILTRGFKGNTTLNVGFLNKGVYFFNIVSGKKISTGKFIKQ